MLLALDGRQERILSELLAKYAEELADKDTSETTPNDLENLSATEGLILQIVSAWGQRPSK